MLGRTHSPRKLDFESLQPRRMLAAVSGVDMLDPADQVEIGGGGGSGKVDVQDISLTEYVDKSSTPLMLKCCKGEHLDDATLAVRESGDAPVDYLVIKMKKILVTSISSGGGAGSGKVDVQDKSSTPLQAYDMVIKIAGVDGESRAGEHADEIDVLSWSWGMTQSGVSHSGGGGGEDRLTENITLNFGEVKAEYEPQGDD